MGDALGVEIVLVRQRELEHHLLAVGQIVEVSTLSRTTVSHHLKVLREAGVLRSEKIGKEVWFWLDKAFLVGALEAVTGYLRERA